MDGESLLSELIVGLRTKNVHYIVAQRGARYSFSILPLVSDDQFELVQFETFVILTVPNKYTTNLQDGVQGASLQGNRLMLSVNCYQLIFLPGSHMVKAVLLEAENKFVNDLKKLYTPKEEIRA